MGLLQLSGWNLGELSYILFSFLLTLFLKHLSQNFKSASDNGT